MAVQGTLQTAATIKPLQDSSNPAARKLERDFPTGFNTSPAPPPAFLEPCKPAEGPSGAALQCAHPVNVGYKQEKESLPSREAARQTTRRKQRSVLELNVHLQKDWQWLRRRAFPTLLCTLPKNAASPLSRGALKKYEFVCS
ncbi:hypothetical protein GGX14DRAFT_407253 [Mycena pura]|uniref:Uncharacterized protein n=1 Tax=Mycena pura TaxID=153505 RepID=A0AAD6UNU7_9AGAR|nr:hypothetical protein GGX14DRAFT_407253 [Mycena pura]